MEAMCYAKNKIVDMEPMWIFILVDLILQFPEALPRGLR